MGRTELELYADRLERHAERLRDDIDGAQMRLAWAEVETGARNVLGSPDSILLEGLGVLVNVDETAERRLIARRIRQLDALERLQEIVNERLRRA